jgi:hypothetical protein
MFGEKPAAVQSTTTPSKIAGMIWRSQRTNRSATRASMQLATGFAEGSMIRDRAKVA